MIYLLILIISLILILIYVYIKQFAHNFNFLKKAVLSTVIIIFTLAVVLYPKESYNAAAGGLNIWFNIVCPSLLPFFIGSELLINLGVVSFIGILLEPVMRPVFNVPGCGSFPFVMSITSGYPVGSKIVAQLYKNKLCTRTEAQRLVSFCSTSGPLFMVGAVAIGMLGVEESASVIAVSHYLGALTVGILFRFYKYDEKTVIYTDSGIIKKAFKKLKDSFNSEKRPVGLLLSVSVKNSVNTLLVIGGFIVLFSVIIRLVILSGFIDIISRVLYPLFTPMGVNSELISPTMSGLFEITIGSKLIASSGALLNQKILAICAIISWSGFSIHAQVASMISSTDIKMGTYMFSKMLHSIFSCLYAYVIISIIEIPYVSEVFKAFSSKVIMVTQTSGWTAKLIMSWGRFFIVLSLFLIAVFLYVLVNKIISMISH